PLCGWCPLCDYRHTGTQLSTEERIWAGAEAVVTLATLGSFAAGQAAIANR
ncbi:TPA: hypothetical protein U0628_002122, partial [Streptococcus suis]|nr:hypothetical protein [Streptococcus suis]